MFESTSVTIHTSVKLAQASNCVPAALRVQSSRLVATEGATPSPNTPEQSESLLANRLGHTLEPAFDFEQQVTVWNRRCPGRLTLRGFEPDLYRIKPEWVSLPTDGKRSFQGLNDPPPLKWSALRYGFRAKEDHDAEEETQAR